MTMTRQRRPKWPFGPDDAASRAKVVAHFYHAALQQEAPEKAAEVKALFAQLGEGDYLEPRWSAPPAGGGMTRAEVAELAGVTVDVVRMWKTRGIVLAGEKRVLEPHSGGRYDADEVDAFLRARDPD